MTKVEICSENGSFIALPGHGEHLSTTAAAADGLQHNITQATRQHRRTQGMEARYTRLVQEEDEGSGHAITGKGLYVKCM